MEHIIKFALFTVGLALLFGMATTIKVRSRWYKCVRCQRYFNEIAEYSDDPARGIRSCGMRRLLRSQGDPPNHSSPDRPS